MKSNPKMYEAMRQVVDIMNQIDARSLWQTQGPNMSLLKAYAVGSGVVIVQYWKDGGWTHFIPGVGGSYDAMLMQLHQLKALNV